jgi:hypothetical protein
MKALIQFFTLTMVLCLAIISCKDDKDDDNNDRNSSSSSSGGGTDVASICEDLIGKTSQCLPQIEAVACAGYSSSECYVYLKDDAQEICEESMADSIDSGEMTASEAREGIDMILEMTCSDLAEMLAPYVDVTSAIVPFARVDIEVVDILDAILDY